MVRVAPGSGRDFIVENGEMLAGCDATMSFFDGDGGEILKCTLKAKLLAFFFLLSHPLLLASRQRW